MVKQFSFFPTIGKEDKAHATKNKYDFGEVTSALQKAIRRGQEEEALYWAYELHESGAWQYLMKRLCVIASEDIGLADIQAGIVAESAYSACTLMWAKAQASGGYYQADLNIIGKVVMYLCRAPKNRICDIATSLVYEKRKRGWKLEVPPEAIDQHTARGKEKIQEEGIDPNRQFYLEGAKVKNRKVVQGDQYYWFHLMTIYGLLEEAKTVGNEELK